MKIENRLKELNITMPALAKPGASFLDCRRVNNLLYLSGIVPINADGVPIKTGKLGSELTIEQGCELAKYCATYALAVMQKELGDLDRVVQIVHMLAIVAAGPDFYEPHLVINAASDTLIDVFGEKGKHTRFAFNTCSLAMNLPLEIQLTVEVKN